METTAPFTLKACLTQLLAQLLRQNKSKHSERTVPLRANCNNDQHYRDEQQPFDTTTRKRTTEEEKTRMITHGSNKTTGLYNSHDDHDTASVSQHIKDARSPFYTPERRTRADSAGSEQKYSHKPRLSTSVTLNTEDELSDNTNESQHYEFEETEKMYQHNIPENESEPNDMQQRIKTLSNREDIQHDK